MALVRRSPFPGGEIKLEATVMKDPVYKLIELTGTSTSSIEDAVNKAIKRANKTIKNLCWFQLVETRGNIEKGKVHHWQVTIKVGFAVKD
jgi:flavin-binding protein dodecin